MSLKAYALAMVALIFSATLSLAATNAIFTNGTTHTITLGGKKIAPDTGSYTTLWGVTGTLLGKTFTLKDENQSCGDWKWKISAKGKAIKDKTACIPVGFGEIGCVFILVLEERDKNDKTKGTGVFTAEIQKAAGHSCSDKWWTSNKDDVWKGISSGLTYQSNAASVLSSLVSLVGAAP